MYHSSTCLDIPSVDICSWTFGNPCHQDFDRPVYIDALDPTRFLTYHTTLSLVRKLVGGLLAAGLEPGDTVCLHAYNNIYYPALFFGIVGARGVFAGANPAYTTYELNHVFSITAAKYVIVEPGLLERTLPAARECGIPDSRVFLLDIYDEPPTDGFRSWTDLLRHEEQDWHRLDDANQQKTTIAALAPTSGTTGLPKAAQLSHLHFVAMSLMTEDHKKKSYDVVRLYSIPMFHAFTAPMSHIPPLRNGFPTFIMKRFELENYLEHLTRYTVTETATVTPIVLALLATTPEQKQSLRTLRCVVTAGSPLDACKQNALCDLCHPEATFGQVWGMTETSWITAFEYPEKDREGSVGRLLPNTVARVVDEDGKDLYEEGAHGEILIRSPTMMLGYRLNDDATASTIVDGWLCTGDVGYTRGGKWWIVDRKKDLIKVRGWQVSPAELEQCLMQHPVIGDAAVIGVDFRDDRGELPRAYIVLRPGAEDPGDEAILAFMGQRLASYKALAGGIVRLDEMPRNQSGKLQKPLLRERAKAEMQLSNGH